MKRTNIYHVNYKTNLIKSKIMGEQFFMDALQIPFGPWPHDLKAQVIYVGWWVIMIVMIGYWSFTDSKRPKSSWMFRLKSRIKSKNK